MSSTLPHEEKKGIKEDKQTLADFSSAYRRSQAKCQLAQTTCILMQVACLKRQD